MSPHQRTRCDPLARRLDAPVGDTASSSAPAMAQSKSLRARSIARLQPSGSISVRISAGGATSLDPYRGIAPDSTPAVPHCISVHRVVDAAIAFNVRVGSDDKAPATTIRLRTPDGRSLNAADARGGDDQLELAPFEDGVIKSVELDADDAVRVLQIDVFAGSLTVRARFTLFVARDAGYATALAMARRLESTGLLSLSNAAASSSAPGVTSDLFDDAGSDSSVPTSSPPIAVKPRVDRPLPRPTPGGAGQVLDASASAQPRGPFALSLLGRVEETVEAVEEDEDEEDEPEPCDCATCRPREEPAVEDDEEAEEDEEDGSREGSSRAQSEGGGLFGSSPAAVGQPHRPTVARKLAPAERLPDPSPDNPNATVFLSSKSANGFAEMLLSTQTADEAFETVLRGLGLTGSDVIARCQLLKRRADTLRRQVKDFAHDPAAAQRILDEASRNDDELQRLLLRAASRESITPDDLASPHKRRRTTDVDSPRKRSKPALDTLALSPMIARIAKSCPHRAAELAAAKPVLRENLIAGDVIGTLGVSGLISVGVKPGTAAAIVQAVERESDAS